MTVDIDLLVIGLGYVGLPLAREASQCGLRVMGYDLKHDMVASLNAGQSHVGDISDEDVAEMLTCGFRATAGEDEVPRPDTIVICVPTPLSAESLPDLRAVRGAAEMAGRLLRPGMLVVLESTTYLGTTDEVIRPLLEQASGLTVGTDFHLAFSPERIDPGNKALRAAQHAQGRRRPDPRVRDPAARVQDEGGRVRDHVQVVGAVILQHDFVVEPASP